MMSSLWRMWQLVGEGGYGKDEVMVTIFCLCGELVMKLLKVGDGMGGRSGDECSVRALSF